MKTKRILWGMLILLLLSCNYLNRMLYPVAPTALPTATLPPALPSTPTVEALKPSFIPPECESVPLATALPSNAEIATPAPEPEHELSHTEQVELFDELTDTIRERYVYPDFNGRDWNGIESRYEARIDEGLDTEAFYQAMREMTEELGDDHSIFFSPHQVEHVDAEMEGNNEFVGVGIWGKNDFQRGRHIVIDVFPGSSADNSGIQPHDAILKVDGLPITRDSGYSLKGPKCSAAVVTVQSPGQAPRDVMLIRHTIRGGLLVTARQVMTTDGSKIGYMFIPNFFEEDIPEQVERALENFGDLDGLILDVRENDGGSNFVVDPIFSHFVHGTLGEFTTRENSYPMEVNAEPIANSQTVPLVVIVSQDTISYGEIFAGVLRDQGRARITGETSLGNVEVMYPYNFEDGSRAWIASAIFHPEHASDANWEQTGIIPDLPAIAPWDTFTFETDPSIAAALTLLGHK